MFHSPFYPLQAASSAASRMLSAVTSGGSFSGASCSCSASSSAGLNFSSIWFITPCSPFFKFFRVESNSYNRSRFLRRRLFLSGHCLPDEAVRNVTIYGVHNCFILCRLLYQCEELRKLRASVLSSFANASTKLILLDLLSFGEIVSIKQARRLASSSFIIKVSYYLSDPAGFFRGQSVAGNLENNFFFPVVLSWFHCSFHNFQNAGE